MKYVKDSEILNKLPTWEESSGFLSFLYDIPKEVEKFNKSFGFDLNYKVTPPVEIDGKKDTVRKVGFVLIRENPLLPERKYCLYSLLEQGVLFGYTGIYEDGNIKTLRKLSPIKDYKKAAFSFYDWARSLIKASCDK